MDRLTPLLLRNAFESALHLALLTALLLSAPKVFALKLLIIRAS